jgi:hypothetical protein
MASRSGDRRASPDHLGDALVPEREWTGERTAPEVVEQPAVQQPDTVADPNRNTEIVAQEGVVQIAPSYRKRPDERVGVRLASSTGSGTSRHSRIRLRTYIRVRTA